ncbi:uncharacterized protein [Hemitrygon akajei]|uniref:uncharacterized protein n=1 Tax=Hemitrygon akajei TaxID=2704970 RepID=UPI003BF9E5E8
MSAEEDTALFCICGNQPSFCDSAHRNCLRFAGLGDGITVARCLLLASTGVSVWLTVAFTCDRFVAICCENLKTKYCTERTAAVRVSLRPPRGRILTANRIRMGLRRRSNGNNEKDPEVENRRKSVVLLFSITGSFIFLWLTRVVFDIYARIASIPRYLVAVPNYIADSTATMLQILSSCTNTCIYAVTQSKFREELKNAVKYPLKLLTKFVKL